MINLKLQPDINYGSKTYTRFGKSTEGHDSVVLCKSPIIEVYKSIEFPFLLLAEGGQGKTTAAKILQAYLIYQNIPCHTYECKNITEDIVKSLASKFSKDSIIIFDAWDEIRRDVKEDLIKSINELIDKEYKVIITSRYNPAFDDSKDSTEKDLFKKFKNIATISTFKEEQIKEIICENIDENSRLFSLLENTMFLSMYIELDDEDKPKFWNTQNSYQFMREYFEILLNKKGQGEINIDGLFYAVGKIIYLEYKAKYYCETDAEFEMVFSSNVNTYSALNHIIYEYKYYGYKYQNINFIIKTSHQNYRMFCLSIYLRYELLRFLKNTNKTIPEAISLKYNEDFIEALILLGESLNFEQIENIRTIINYTNDCIYENLLSILLGANNQCFNDDFLCIPGEGLSFIWREANKYIKKIHLHHVTKIGAGGTDLGFSLLRAVNLKEIIVADDHPTFKADGNCLIRKLDNTLILGCCKSVIPNYVKTIEKYAFDNCENLNFIHIPDFVTNIGDDAFSGCDKLKELILPDSVITVGDFIISHCGNLEKLVIGRGLKKIHTFTFYMIRNNNLHEITVSPENPNYYSEGNCLIERNTKTVILGCKNSIIPKDIKEIGKHAFCNCKNLKSIHIPNSVTKIGDEAFSGCDELKELILPDSVITVGDYIISHCGNLEKLVIGKGLEKINKRFLEYDGNNVLYENNLQEIIVSPQNPTYYSEGNCLIERNTKKVILGCQNSIIPKDIKKIGKYAFSEIGQIKEVIIPNGVESIGYDAFNYSNIRKLVIPDTIRYVGKRAFGILKLDELEIPVSLKDSLELVWTRRAANLVYVRNSDGSLQLMEESNKNY